MIVRIVSRLILLLVALAAATTLMVGALSVLNPDDAAKLLDLTEPGGARTRRITQVELATMVGGARQTVNQALRSLESRGYIRSDGRVFEILDREQLRRLAGG